VSGIGRLVAVGHSQSVGRVTRESAADVIPTVAVDADVLESDQRVGEDLKPATTSAFAEGEVLAEIEVAAAGRDYHRKEERGCGWGAPPGARGKLLLALDLQKDLAAYEQEAAGRVEDLDEPTAFPQGDRFLTGQELGGPLPLEFLGVETADDRQAVRPKTLHRLGLEGDVGVDPLEFLEAVGYRLGRNPVARDVDLREAVETADGIT
jgi:hypothetical protein